MNAQLHGFVAAAHTPFEADGRLIQLLAAYGYMGAAKALMGMLGVPVGPARLPNGSLSPDEKAKLQGELDQLGFFSWIQKNR